MLGRRSQNPNLSPFNPERILSTRTPPITMAEDLPTARPMKEYFTPTYASASCIRVPNTGVNHYEMKSSVIQLLPSFLWTYQ